MIEKNLIVTKIEESSGGNHYHISYDGGGFGIETKWGVKPKIGDSMDLHLINGCMVRGLDLNGKRVFYKTQQDLDDDHARWLEKHQKEKEEQFVKEEKSLNETYDKLPEFFKKRIDKFRKDNPKFRIDYESYELFTCSEAVLIAETLKTPEKVKEFSECDDRWSMVPNLDKGHSGNTMGAATGMAYWYLKQPDSVTKIPGALAPLVGSREYEEKNKRRKLGTEKKGQ